MHWDPYLHAWVVTRYDDVGTVFRRFSADRTPSPGVLRGPRGARGRAHRPGDGQADAVPGRARAHPAAPAGRRRRSSRCRSASCARTSRTSPTGLIDDVLARGDGPDGHAGRLRRAAAGDGHHRAARRAGRAPRRAQGLVGHVRRDARQLPAQPGPARRRARRPSRTSPAYFRDAIREQRDDPRDGPAQRAAGAPRSTATGSPTRRSPPTASSRWSAAWRPPRT